jgi:hypothetical protein
MHYALEYDGICVDPPAYAHLHQALSLKNEILSLQKQLGDKLMADEALKYQVGWCSERFYASKF